MAKQNQLAKPVFPEISQPHQQFLSQLVDTVNSLAGRNGTIELNNHINLGGNKIINVGSPTSPTDAVNFATTEAKYSAPVLSKQLNIGGQYALKSLSYVYSKQFITYLTQGGVGTVTGVVAGTGLSGGGSDGSVTLDIAPTAVIPGSYTNTNLTVNAEGQITAAANGAAGTAYVKGTVSIGPQGAAGTYTASGTVAGATVGSAVLVGVVNSTEAGIFSNLIGYVTAPNTVSIQVTANAAFLLVALPVVVFV